MQKNHIVIAAMLVVGLLFTLATYFYSNQQMEAKNATVTLHADSLIRLHSVKKGDPSAKVTIVEFLDPACATCKKFHPIIDDLLKEHPEKINLVVRYLPFHHGSDQMVAILEAAKRQKQFWNVLDIMFETQGSWIVNHRAKPELFWVHLKDSGINVARIKKDMNNPRVKKIIEQDLADGKLLGATKTPTFFVNGKPLSSFGLNQLMSLVDSELEANY